MRPSQPLSHPPLDHPPPRQPRADRPPLLGILGGMGPLATVDLMRKIIERTPARSDADHVPMLVANFPQIPARLAAWARRDDTPLAPMIVALKTLEDGGATLGVIACNTAHLWFEAMQAATRVPLLHIADATIVALRRRTPLPRSVGLLATGPTLQGRLYHDRLEAAGFTAIAPDEETQRTLVDTAIDAVKRNDPDCARMLARGAATALIAAGSDCLLLGCTEMPIALEGSAVMDASVDPTAALADACVAWWLQQRN